MAYHRCRRLTTEKIGERRRDPIASIGKNMVLTGAGPVRSLRSPSLNSDTEGITAGPSLSGEGKALCQRGKTQGTPLLNANALFHQYYTGLPPGSAAAPSVRRGLAGSLQSARLLNQSLRDMRQRRVSRHPPRIIIAMEKNSMAFCFLTRDLKLFLPPQAAVQLAASPLT